MKIRKFWVWLFRWLEKVFPGDAYLQFFLVMFIWGMIVFAIGEGLNKVIISYIGLGIAFFPWVLMGLLLLFAMTAGLFIDWKEEDENVKRTD